MWPMSSVNLRLDRLQWLFLMQKRVGSCLKRQCLEHARNMQYLPSALMFILSVGFPTLSFYNKIFK